MMNKQKMEMDNDNMDMEDDNMNSDWIRGIHVDGGIKNVNDIKKDIKEAVDIMEKDQKVSKEYRDLITELCNDKSNDNLVTVTIDDKMKLGDAMYHASQIKEMLDMVDIAVNVGNVDGKPNKMRRWYDEENIRRVVEDWLAKNPGVSIVYPDNNNENNENETTVMEDNNMLNDYEREHLEQKLDDLNRIKSSYDKYEWLLDVDPGHDIDAKTQIDITRLYNILRNCLDNCELLTGINDDAKREIIESAYSIIKHHRDETCKQLKTFLYKTGDNNDEH